MPLARTGFVEKVSAALKYFSLACLWAIDKKEDFPFIFYYERSHRTTSAAILDLWYLLTFLLNISSVEVKGRLLEKVQGNTVVQHPRNCNPVKEKTQQNAFLESQLKALNKESEPAQTIRNAIARQGIQGND